MIDVSMSIWLVKHYSSLLSIKPFQAWEGVRDMLLWFSPILLLVFQSRVHHVHYIHLHTYITY